MPPSVAIRFASERFDYRSELPATANAGNRFYGADVAAFLTDQLAEQGLAATFLDEDWGWLVLSARGAPVDFEVAVYNLAEHGEGGRPGVGDWGLWVRAYERRRRLGVLPMRAEVAVPAALRAAVERAVRAAGAEPRAWDDGPAGR